MNRTTYYPSAPGFLADTNPNSVVRNQGRQVDFARVADSFKNADGKKAIPAGTIVAELGSGKVVPRYAAPAASQSITSITEAGGTATATKVGHGYETGDVVSITGATGANADAYNTTHTVTKVDADTFTFPVAAATGDAAGAPVGELATTVGILATPAVEDAPGAALTGYGVLVSAHVFENLLPDAGGNPVALTAAQKADLRTNGGAWVFSTYQNTFN